MEIEILSRKLVKPSSPIQQDLRSYKISSLDQLAIPHYIPMILYYHPSHDDDDAIEPVPRPNLGDMKRKLEESLSRVLQVYYPLAGRYFKENFTVDCNDGGVELVEANVSCKLSQVLDRDFNANELNKLISFRMESETSPLFVVQFNMFECGGIAIGTSFSHRLGDGSSRSGFINEWAQASRELSIDVGYKVVHSPDFLLPSIFHAREGLCDDQGAPTHKGGTLEIVTKRFVFNVVAIDKLKAMASAKAPVGSRFSRVEVVTALIWKALIKANQARNGGKSRPSLLTHPMNLRQRTGLQIPKNAFGNAVIPAVSKFIPSGGEVELPELVHLIHDTFTRTLKNCSELTNADDLYYTVTEAWREVNQLYGKYDVYRFTSWSSLPFYEADFGWGKPTWVSSIHIPVEMTLLFGTEDGKGVEAWLNFEQNLMLLLQQDADLLAFTS